MIVGAGLAGLISAHVFPRESVVEISPEPNAIHKALLRFRTPSVGELTGIEFKPVTVRKGIWDDRKWHAPNITHANLYATKVLGRLMDRSIWDLDPVTRYVAPEDFYERLIDAVGNRIVWDADWREAQLSVDRDKPIISTIPMNAMLDSFCIDTGESFKRASIIVKRFRIPACDLYQTVYFPTDRHPMYRASITGDLLICEFADEPIDDRWETDLRCAFGLSFMDYEELETSSQKFGKIAPINEGKRRAAIAQLTGEHSIFSIGRFATWRNILLDDVVHDAMVVKRLINASDYDRKLIGAKR